MFSMHCIGVFSYYLFLVFDMHLALKVKRQNEGLTSVPQDINVLVTNLILKDNEITRITNTSLSLYVELISIDLTRNDIMYIEDGAFDTNGKLKKITATNNDIKGLPRSFGAAAGSLEHIMFWAALHYSIITKMNLTELTSLSTINIGSTVYRSGFDAALLPRNLEWICINVARLQNFPDFAPNTPNIHSIILARNEITYIPETAIMGLSELIELGINENRLLTLPDLFHLPMNDLSMRENLLECNQSVCWVRMAPWLRQQLILDDITCNSPQVLQGQRLMDIHPVKLSCHDGMSKFIFPADKSRNNNVA